MNGNDGGTPIPVEREDTGRLSRELQSTMTTAGTMTAGTMMSGEDIIDRIAEKVAEVNRNGGGGRRFLGLEAGSLTKIFALVVAMSTWYLAVRDGLNARPTADQIEQIIGGTIRGHDGAADSHPPFQKRLDATEVGQRKIRESQIRQETLDETQTEVLKEIKDDLKQLGKRRNRR